MIDVRQKMKIFCTRCGAAKSWTEFGERIRHGTFGTRGRSPISASCLPGFLITKGTRSYLLSPFGPFGTKETRFEPSHPTVFQNLVSQWAHDKYVEFNDLKKAPSVSRPRRQVRWKPPDEGDFKINFDGAIFAGMNCSGLGIVVRDKEGLAITSMVARIPQQLQPTKIEALAAYKAIGFARELGLSQVVLEGDSSIVMSALNSSNPGLAPFGLLVQDTLNVAIGFSKLSYSHTKREGNSVAHNLAQLAANIPNCVIWMEDVPSDVICFYHVDLAGIP